MYEETRAALRSLEALFRPYHPNRRSGENKFMFRVSSPQSAVLYFRDYDDMKSVEQQIEDVLRRQSEPPVITMSAHPHSVENIYAAKPPYQIYLGFEHDESVGHALWMKLLNENVYPEEHGYIPPETMKPWEDEFQVLPDDRDLQQAHLRALETNQATIEHLEKVKQNLLQGQLSPQAQAFLATKKDEHGPYAATQKHADELIAGNPLLSGHPKIPKGWEKLDKILENLRWRKKAAATPQLELLAETTLHHVLDKLAPLDEDQKHAIAERQEIIDHVIAKLRAQQDYNGQALDALAARMSSKPDGR